MDKFPREIQNELLMHLYTVFPHCINHEKYTYFEGKFNSSDEFAGNLIYLSKHGLIEASLSQSLGGDIFVNTSSIKITHRGIDFIRDDGGLSSILNIATVKIHDDTIEKLAGMINGLDLSPKEKETYFAKLKELPLDATKHLMTKIIDLGLSQAGPSVLQLIDNLSI